MTEITIAIADDHTLLREALAEMLSHVDEFEVVCQAPDGRALVTWLEQAPALPDICILDISMPVMDGYQALVHIKDRWPQVKVLMLSMFVTEFNIVRTLKAGACGLLPKDEALPHMLQALRQIHKDGFCDSRYLPQSILLAARRQRNTGLRITDKELDFLKRCASELTYTQIAGQMGVGKRTVDSYRESLFQKLSITSRTGLAIFAIQSGLVRV